MRNTFPLSHIDKALQVLHISNVFTSFDLVQEYLWLVMAEDDIKKTAFRAGSSVYPYAFWPIKCWVKLLQVNGVMSSDQQFVTLLLYLDDIVFLPQMLSPCWTGLT